MKRVVDTMESEVQKMRDILGCNESDVINKNWMKDNLGSILKLNIFILDQCERQNVLIKQNNIIKQENGSKRLSPCIKLFHLLPLHTIKPHFISIDNSVFEGLYKEVFSIIEKSYGTEKTLKILPVMKNNDWCCTKETSHMYWNRIFDIYKLQGQHNTFSNHIGTDGKAIDFHYKRQIGLKECFVKDLNNKLKKIEEKYKLEEVIDENQVIQANEEHNGKANAKKRKKPKKLQSQEDEENEAISEFLDGKRVLGLDPGRVTIMFVAEELDDGRIRSYKLTRCHYYRKSGILKSRRRTECWMRKNNEYKQGIRLLSQNSIKSFCWEGFQSALNVYNSKWDVFWNERMKMRWSSNNFDLYGGKKRVFQNFFNDMDKDNTCNKQTVIS